MTNEARRKDDARPDDRLHWGEACSICDDTGTAFGKTCVCRIETDTQRAKLANALRRAALDLLEYNRTAGACLEIEGKPPLYILIGDASAIGKLWPGQVTTTASASTQATQAHRTGYGAGVRKAADIAEQAGEAVLASRIRDLQSAGIPAYVTTASASDWGSVIDDIADELQEKSNLGVISLFTALCEEFDRRAPAPSREAAPLEDAAKAIYRLFPGAEAHPWQEGGNSIKQDEARRYARAAIAQQGVAQAAPTEGAAS